ncbi:hypothetical protein [Sphingomonas sp. PP-CC-3G-468]|uniref:hypothetical protein n=1 Tax=Sphingomonas sp. PP-CC-3G-468 TaxID=2135656 RepID=UPI0010448920|nr:hypothetical protein [Sphingomonas sp. PP-CC-3G-468]TCM07454.1 hypothetical protein C8J41_103362 [Sphingomonas sp. PP-CC-3G-468]
MKDQAQHYDYHIAMMEDAIRANRNCGMDGLFRRVMKGSSMGTGSEVVVVVAAADTGRFFGHVMFDAVVDQWRSFMLHSNASIDQADVGCELIAYRNLVILEQNYSLVYSYDGARTSARVDGFGEAIRAMSEIIVGFEPDAVWPASPGPRHQLDFAPFDAYRFLERQSR